MKVIVLTLVLLLCGDVVVDHGAQTARVMHGIGGFFSAIGGSFHDSILRN